MKKVLSLLLTAIMLLSVVSTISAIEVTNNTENTSVEYETISQYIKEKDAGAGTYVIDFGKAGDYSIFFATNFAHPDTVSRIYLGDYLFYTPCYTIDMYVVKGKDVYTLQQAYDKKLVDIEEVVDLISSYKGEYAKYIFWTIYEKDENYVAGHMSTKETFIQYLKDNNMYDENSLVFGDLGKVENYQLCYGYGIVEPVSGGSITLGDYNIWTPATTPFQSAGLYLIKDKKVILLKQAYEDGKITEIKEVISLLYENKKEFGFVIAKSMHNETAEIKALCREVFDNDPLKMEQGYVCNLGVTNGYNLYYALKKEAGYSDYENTLGNYIFRVNRSSYPSYLALYLVKDNKVYDVNKKYKEIVNQEEINEEIISLIRSYKGEEKKDFCFKIYDNAGNNITDEIAIPPPPQPSTGEKPVKHDVRYCLTHVISSNTNDYILTKNYETILSPGIGYKITDIFATSGDMQAEVNNNNNGTYSVYFSKLDGPIFITAYAVPINIETTKLPKISATTAKLNAGTVKNLKVTDGKVKTWTTSNKKVAIVRNGTVTGLSKGTAKITATLTTGKKLTCTATVKTNPKLNKTTVNVKKGKTVTVKLTGKATAVNNKYTNTKYAKVISNAKATAIKIKGIKKGTTTLKIRVNGVKAFNLKVKIK